jgi:hypothetical protein
VQPPISRMKEVALEAHAFGVDGSSGYGGDAFGVCYAGDGSRSR